MDIKTEQFGKQSFIVRNLEDICRICLVSGELEPLASSKLYSTYQLLARLLNFQSNNEFPKNICKPCSMDLERISSFISRLKESTSILKMSQENNDKLDLINVNKVNNCEISIEYVNETDETVQNLIENKNDDFEKVLIECKKFEDHVNYIEHGNETTEYLIENKDEDVEKALIECKDSHKENHRQPKVKIITNTSIPKINIQTMINDAKSNKIPAFACQICEKGFISKNALDLHEALHTQNDSDTEEVIKFEIERKTEIEKPHICNICNKGFVYEISWKYHMTSHAQEKLCECTYCDWMGINEIELNEHVQKDHCHKVDISEDETLLDYICRVCGKYFSNTKELQEHLDSHEKKFKCKHCGLSFKMKSTLMKHLHHHNDEGLFNCTFCDKVLTRKIFLKQHIETVHSKEPVKKPKPIYFCSTCNKGFFFLKNLVKHEKLHKQEPCATNQEPDEYPCEHCGNRFTYKANLLRHIRITHAGVKKFSCTLCDEKFTVKNSLIYHMNIHNNAKPFQCEICSRAFRQPSALIRHKIQVHQTKEKHFKCELCDKLLKSNVSLRAHMKRHEEA